MKEELKEYLRENLEIICEKETNYAPGINIQYLNICLLLEGEEISKDYIKI